MDGNTTTTLPFSGGNIRDALTSTNPAEVWKALQTLFRGAINALPPEEQNPNFFGLTNKEAADLYREVKATSDREDRLWDVRESLKGLSAPQLAALGQFEAVAGHMWSAANIIAQRNLSNQQNGATLFDREARQKSIVEEIQFLKDKRVSAETVEKIYGEKRFWLTYTAHPTKDKTETGETLFRELIGLADKPLTDPAADVSRIISAMLQSEITPRKKDSFEDETRDGQHAQRVYNQGMVNYFQDVQRAFDKVYGPNVINLIGERMTIDVACHKWHGGDADGKKVPATVLFRQRVSDAIESLKFSIEELDGAHKRGGANSDLLLQPLQAFHEIQANLEALYLKAQEINDSTSPEFTDAMAEFQDAFKSINYQGQSYTVGPKLTGAMMDDLRYLAGDSDAARHVREASWRTVFLHKQNGTALGRTELRHNGADYQEIFRNLYKYLKEQDRGKDTIDRIIKEPEESLDDFPPQAQIVLLARLMREHGDKTADWLMAANPPSDDPEQNWKHEILQRFRMVSMCYNFNRMGVAIIAEANEVSPVQQQFMAEAFGIKNMVHVPLNESENTIERAEKNFLNYARVSGARNIQERQKIAGSIAAAFLCLMDPQSDSQKSNGIGMKPLQRDVAIKLLKRSAEDHIAFLQKIGTGASKSRGGFPPEVMTRQFVTNLTSLPGWQQMDQDVLIRLAQFVSTTNQGRQAGYTTATPEQVYDMCRTYASETNAAVEVVLGLARPTDVAPKPIKYSTAMKSVLGDIEAQMREIHEHELRGLTSTRGGQLARKRIDLYMEHIAPLTVSNASNVGARPDARNKGRAPYFSELRAIGTTKATMNSETQFDASYLLGFQLCELHRAYMEERITREDLKDFLSDDFYMRQMYGNAFSGLAAGDYEHGYDEMMHGSTLWRVRHVLAAVKRDYHSMSENAAFHTVLLMDALKAVSYMEALMRLDEGGFDKIPEEIIAGVYPDTDVRLNKLQFGERTKEFYPVIGATQDITADNMLSRALVHETERRNKSGELAKSGLDVKAFNHHMATMRSNHAPEMNLGNLLGRDSFGASDTPVFSRIVASDYKPNGVGRHNGTTLDA